jgi:branched-chain amino acid transport system substrate-binding protein
MKKGALTAALYLTLASVGCGSGNSNDQPANPDLTIGVLVNESGSETDQFVLAAARLAAQNAQASGVTVAVVSKNTNGDGAGAAQALQELLNQGVKVVVGPTSSGEAQGALPLANSAGALLVSPGSTAQSLAIAGDALYRLSPTNDVLSQTTLDLVQEEGFSALVTVNRDDLGNTEEASELRRLAAANGIALQPPISYPTDTGTDFRGVAGEIANAVTRAGGSPAAVAVAVFGLEEVADLLADCAGYSELQGVTFFGSDGISQNSVIVSSAGPAFFALGAGNFPSPLLSVPPDQQAEATAISSQIGDPLPDAFSLNGYDAVTIMVNAFKADSSFAAGGAATRAAFVAAADGYSGLTGTIDLDAAGDRISGHYTYWGVCSLGGLINWYGVGSWSPRSPSSTQGVATFVGCPVE